MASTSRLLSNPTRTTLMTDEDTVPSKPGTFAVVPVRHLVCDTDEDLRYDNDIRGGTMGQARRFPMPHRKLSLRQGRIDMAYKHKINYKSAYDYDKKTTRIMD